MKADKEEFWQRLKDSAPIRLLRSPRGPLIAAVAVAAIAISVYLACNMRSCTSSSQSTVYGGSLWRTGSGATEDELGNILSQIEGAGSTDVLITYDKSGAVVGVVVVSEGAADKEVTVRLMRAVRTATGADIDRIEIFEKKK